MTETFLSASWENLIMANYAVNPKLLESFLPNGVELDFYNHKTYVSLVGFMFKKTSLFNIPIPFFGSFQEINLRFYVKRMEGNTIKRGVVFINETVPYQSVAWLANKLYKEHYMAIPTKSLIKVSETGKRIKYEWKINNNWDYIEVDIVNDPLEMPSGSIEEFIFEHYYGYTKISTRVSQEYKVNHPRWQAYKVLDYSIHCDFTSMYGKEFSFLNTSNPDSVIIAKGSPVTVNWKKINF